MFGIIVIFALQNTQSVDVNFLFWDFGIPLIVVITATMVLSVVFGDMIDWWWKRRKKKRKEDDLKGRPPSRSTVNSQRPERASGLVTGSPSFGNELFDLLRSLELPVGDYAIFGSGPLIVRGIIEATNDLDIICPGCGVGTGSASR